MAGDGATGVLAPGNVGIGEASEYTVDGYTKDDLIRARASLIDRASRRRRLTYSQFAQDARLAWDHQNPNDRSLIGHLLGDVSHEEYRRGRPLLSALVVRQDIGKPGQGFFGIEGFPSSTEFWRAELKRVYDFWSWRTKPFGTGFLP